MNRFEALTPLHSLVREAARGELPAWAVLTPGRRRHVERVAALLEAWARARKLDETEVLRWRGLGMLHDALRDEDPERLRPLVPRPLADLAPAALHAPAAAIRLRAEGVADEELLHAVSHHSIGSRDWGLLGRSLYLADFLEPGRSFRPGWRAELRDRVPAEADAVLREVVRARIEWAMAEAHPVRIETVDFWNALLDESRGG